MIFQGCSLRDRADDYRKSRATEGLPGQLSSLSIPLLIHAMGEKWENVSHLSRRAATQHLFSHCHTKDCAQWLTDHLFGSRWAPALSEWLVTHRCEVGNELFVKISTVISDFETVSTGLFRMRDYCLIFY